MPVRFGFVRIQLAGIDEEGDKVSARIPALAVQTNHSKIVDEIVPSTVLGHMADRPRLGPNLAYRRSRRFPVRCSSSGR